MSPQRCASPLHTHTHTHTQVILVRLETSPEDVGGMHAAQGILTARGGMTSHAAVVARGWGKPCVCGLDKLEVDYAAKTATLKGQVLKEGDWLALNGSSGEVLAGKQPVKPPVMSGARRRCCAALGAGGGCFPPGCLSAPPASSASQASLPHPSLPPPPRRLPPGLPLSTLRSCCPAPPLPTPPCLPAGDLAVFMEWVDSFRKIGVFTNADTPADALVARKNGAQGIGLVRTGALLLYPVLLLVFGLVLAPGTSVHCPHAAQLAPHLPGRPVLPATRVCAPPQPLPAPPPSISPCPAPPPSSPSSPRRAHVLCHGRAHRGGAAHDCS